MNQQEPKPAQLTPKQNFWQAVRFTLISISAGLVQMGSFALLDLFTDLPYWPKYLVALVLSVLWNFTINRRFTFKSANNVPVAMLKIAGYYALFTPLSTWWGDALARANVNEYIILIGTMVINLVTEYLFCRFVVYRNSMNTNDIAQREAEREAQQETDK